MTQKRIRDYGIAVGHLKTGPRNKITDVAGVRVGHCTLTDPNHRTGVTVIEPCTDNIFSRKMIAACHVINGFGKSAGLVQISELGTLESPIALTNTLNVGSVWDAVAAEMDRRCRQDHVEMHSLNPVVGECNDAAFNRITDRPVREAHVLQAMACASEDFEEGAVGAGAGTTCFGLKGGIGSASRRIEIAGGAYTLGVLVQSNHGTLRNLTISGRPVGLEIEKKLADISAECDKGSIMMVVGTDLPVTSRQLGRILRRCAAGLARSGSYYGHGSGDVVLGFTTANRLPYQGMPRLWPMEVLSENALEGAFEACAEATEEAVLNSLVCAEGAVTLSGKQIHSLKEFL